MFDTSLILKFAANLKLQRFSWTWWILFCWWLLSSFLWEASSASVCGDTADLNAGAAQRATTEISEYKALGFQVGGIVDFYVRLLSRKFSNWSEGTKQNKEKRIRVEPELACASVILMRKCVGLKQTRWIADGQPAALKSHVDFGSRSTVWLTAWATDGRFLRSAGNSQSAVGAAVMTGMCALPQDELSGQWITATLTHTHTHTVKRADSWGLADY